MTTLIAMQALGYSNRDLKKDTVNRGMLFCQLEIGASAESPTAIQLSDSVFDVSRVTLYIQQICAPCPLNPLRSPLMIHSFCAPTLVATAIMLLGMVSGPSRRWRWYSAFFHFRHSVRYNFPIDWYESYLTCSSAVSEAILVLLILLHRGMPVAIEVAWRFIFKFNNFFLEGDGTIYLGWFVIRYSSSSRWRRLLWEMIPSIASVRWNVERRIIGF